MISALFNQPNYQAAQKLLDGTVLRHDAIASNLANLETPNYKRLDVAPSFAVEMRQALASGSPGQIAGVQPELAVDSTAVSSKRDGNTSRLPPNSGVLKGHCKSSANCRGLNCRPMRGKAKS